MWCNVNRALLEREPLFSTTVTFGWIFIILVFEGLDLFLTPLTEPSKITTKVHVGQVRVPVCENKTELMGFLVMNKCG